MRTLTTVALDGAILSEQADAIIRITERMRAQLCEPAISQNGHPADMIRIWQRINKLERLAYDMRILLAQPLGRSGSFPAQVLHNALKGDW